MSDEPKNEDPRISKLGQENDELRGKINALEQELLARDRQLSVLQRINQARENVILKLGGFQS